MKSLVARSLPVFLAWACSAAGDSFLALPPPQTVGGMPLMEALARRQSLRDLAPTPLPEDLHSSLLWAANGVNRPESGKRTTPSATNWQGIDLYVARGDGLYLYQPAEHQLRLVMDEDIRSLAGRQTFVRQAPVVLIYVADATRMRRAAPDIAAFYAATDTGFISQNVYLFCAANDLATVVLGYVDKAALGARMQLHDRQSVILTQPVGYPALSVPAVTPPEKTAAGGAAALRDGVYRGTARGYIDDIVVDVTVQQGVIESVEVVQHRENRPGRALIDLPARIVTTRGVDGVDAVTAATVTSDALKNAVRQALESAR